MLPHCSSNSLRRSSQRLLKKVTRSGAYFGRRFCLPRMQKKEIKANVLVSVQFLCALFLVYNTLSVVLAIIPAMMIAVAILIGVWSVLTMRIGNLRFNPIPKTSAKLIMSGPYRLIRHPMYTAALFGMLGVALNINTPIGYSVWVVLLIDILIKMHFEEELLSEKFPEYREYVKHTERLLPFLW